MKIHQQIYNKLTIIALIVALFVLTACTSSLPEYPDPTYVDKTDLAYESSLETYKKSDWIGNWIWSEINAPDMYVAFRKTFTIEDAPDTATAYIAAESKYFMWLNGELSVYDGNAKRGPTLYDSYYDEVELTNLVDGENTLAFLVIYNGRSSDSALDAGKGGLLFETNINGVTIASDSSFKAMRLSAYKNKSLLKSDYPNYSQASMLGEWNVYYDARDSIGDFMNIDFNDKNWDDAIGVAKAGAEPFNDLYVNPVSPIWFGDIEDFENADEYVNQTLSEHTILSLELPKNRQFSPYFELEAGAGQELIIYTDTYDVGGLSTFKDTYITKDGLQSYENYPWRSGSKLFIEAPAGVKFTKLGYRPSGFDDTIASNFVSDDNALNSLWEKSVNTLLINMRDTFMDCPERERAPYAGDGANQIDMVLYSLDNKAYEMIKKSILVEIGWTKNDFLIPSRAPSDSPHEIPVQSLAFIVSAFNYYLFTGDEETMNLFYPVAINYLKSWNTTENGLVEIRDGSWMWTDWGTGIDTEVIQIAWYYYALTTIERLADDLNITEDSSFIQTRKASIKDNFKDVYQQEDGGFRSGDNNDDRANALAVISGLADEEDYPMLINILTTVKQASPFMEKYVLQALVEMGEFQAAYDRMIERYTNMIEDEGSTLWELWSLEDASSVSVNHGWSGGPLVITARYFAGIVPVTPGYESYEITPQNLTDDLNISIGTVKGDIILHVKKNNDGSYTITLNTIVANGIINIPNSFGTNVTFESGNYQDVENKDGYSSYAITGGSYVINIS